MNTITRLDTNPQYTYQNPRSTTLKPTSTTVSLPSLSV